MIGDPFSTGAVNTIMMSCPLLLVDGASGYSGAIAWNTDTLSEISEYPTSFLDSTMNS